MAHVRNDFASDRVSMFVVDPPSDLAPYLSGYYRTRILPGPPVSEWMPPEEANLRTGNGETYLACIGPGELKPIPEIIISGSTDRGTRVQVSQGDYWGVGLTPAGWARFIGLPASDFANRNDDLAAYPALAHYHAMLAGVVAAGEDIDGAIDLMNAGFRARLGSRSAEESTIHAVHHAIGSRRPSTVAQLASMAGMNSRTFERFCKRHFGFPAGTLQRRQRFLRSLGRYMMDPSMRWIDTLDSFYSDQAHFIREFRSVMGMTPGEYAALPHPIVGAAVKVTSASAGVAMQALHTPRQTRGERPIGAWDKAT